MNNKNAETEFSYQFDRFIATTEKQKEEGSLPVEELTYKIAITNALALSTLLDRIQIISERLENLEIKNK